MTCETCKFFKDNECFRYPPVLKQNFENITSSWDGDFKGLEVQTEWVRPFVSEENYCGEWQDQNVGLL